MKISTISNATFRLSSIILVATVWGSTILFGLYILAFYAAALINGHTAQWNKVLPGLYDTQTETATIGIGIHFAAGGIILILGCIQLLEKVRARYPAFHRIIGRIYVLASIFTAVGGLTFIAVKGTIGGTVMDIGFGLYGVLTFIAAIQTIRFARAKDFGEHRAWGIRLFALAIGSWLYRMDYGFWLMLMDGAGHTENFTGTFDKIMSFFFYIPNLIMAEIFIGKKNFLSKPIIKLLGAFFIFMATFVLLIGTYYFTKHLWGPAITDWIF